MGKRGPPPKSKAELERRGSRRAKSRAPEVKGSGKAPKMPTTLDRNGKAEWKRIVAYLEPQGVLDPSFAAVMEKHCQSWSDWKALIAAEKKLLYGSADWKRVYTARNQASLTLKETCEKLGLSPADRTRVKVTTKPRAKDGKAAKFFESGGAAGTAQVAG